MTKEEFINEVEKLGIVVELKKLDQLDLYLQFLKEYNNHTNLTAIKEDNEIYLKHFYDSLTIVKGIDLNNYQNLLDIGSGPGFPGMVLKIFFPNLKVTLIDSNNKKTKFLTELAEKLNVDVEIINDRVENYAKKNLNSFDIVTSRAVANLRVLAELSLPLVKVDGYFVAMKGNADLELEEAKDTIKIMAGKLDKRISFDLYRNSGVRNIIVIKKVEKTIITNLRPYDKILKKPLKIIDK